MGYYTQHTLKVIEGDPYLITIFREESDTANYSLNDDGKCREESTWYDSNTDMKNFSIKHPEALFQMDGEGEKSGDIWRQYWKNGKVQNIRAVLTYEPYDPNKLI